VPQFRALVFVNYVPQAMLADLAEHLGLSPPAASRLVAGLVKRGLLSRRIWADNRRCLTLALTARGRSAFAAAHRHARAALAARLTALSAADVARVGQTMQVLHDCFAHAADHGSAGPTISPAAGAQRAVRQGMSP
jgi:DNA-binding MarR family transcriptional regulator